MRREGKVFQQGQLALAEEFCNSKADPDSIVKEHINKDIGKQISLILFNSADFSDSPCQMSPGLSIQKKRVSYNLRK